MAKVKTLDLNEFGGSRSTGFGLLEFDNNGFATVPSGKEAEFKRLCDISPTLQWVEEENIEGLSSLEKGVQEDSTSGAVDKNVQSLSQEEINEMNQKEHENPGYVEEDSEEDSSQLREVSGEETLQETAEESTLTEESALTEEEKQALREVLQTKTIDELRQVCREAGISEDEIKDFKGAVGKIDLIEFIIKKNII